MFRYKNNYYFFIHTNYNAYIFYEEKKIQIPKLIVWR